MKLYAHNDRFKAQMADDKFSSAMKHGKWGKSPNDPKKPAFLFNFPHDVVMKLSIDIGGLFSDDKIIIGVQSDDYLTVD